MTLSPTLKQFCASTLQWSPKQWPASLDEVFHMAMVEENALQEKKRIKGQQKQRELEEHTWRSIQRYNDDEKIMSVLKMYMHSQLNKETEMVRLEREKKKSLSQKKEFFQYLLKIHDHNLDIVKRALRSSDTYAVLEILSDIPHPLWKEKGGLLEVLLKHHKPSVNLAARLPPSALKEFLKNQPFSEKDMRELISQLSFSNQAKRLQAVLSHAHPQDVLDIWGNQNTGVSFPASIHHTYAQHLQRIKWNGDLVIKLKNFLIRAATQQNIPFTAAMCLELAPPSLHTHVVESAIAACFSSNTRLNALLDTAEGYVQDEGKTRVLRSALEQGKFAIVEILLQRGFGQHDPDQVWEAMRGYLSQQSPLLLALLDKRELGLVVGAPSNESRGRKM